MMCGMNLSKRACWLGIVPIQHEGLWQSYYSGVRHSLVGLEAILPTTCAQFRTRWMSCTPNNMDLPSRVLNRLLSANCSGCSVPEISLQFYSEQDNRGLRQQHESSLMVGADPHFNGVEGSGLYDTDFLILHSEVITWNFNRHHFGKHLKLSTKCSFWIHIKN